MKVLLLLVLSLFIVILNSKFTSKHRNKFMKKNQIRKSLLKHANSLRHGIRAAAHQIEDVSYAENLENVQGRVPEVKFLDNEPHKKLGDLLIKPDYHDYHSIETFVPKFDPNNPFKH